MEEEITTILRKLAPLRSVMIGPPAREAFFPQSLASGATVG